MEWKRAAAWFRDRANVDEGKDINEGGEVGAFQRRRAVWGVLMRLVCGEQGAEEVNGVSEGASSGAAMGAFEGMEGKGGFEGGSGGVGMGR